MVKANSLVIKNIIHIENVIILINYYILYMNNIFDD